MELDWRICSRARLSRDARFDGKFFIAVLSTKIYCRPICPARTCREKNVRYYPTAAAAAEAGYRPCLRCRPESSPGTPAWLGTSSTVSRALRLIGESGLEEGGVEALAERLGIGSRHLRRLFLKHLGATPAAVAHTRRMHFAKKLIDETRLPMNQIAIAAGFGSVRRFNAGIRKFFHRTPTQIRHLARQKEVHPANQYVFHLNFRPPYHWQAMVDFLAPRCTPGLEIVENGCYRRSISVDGKHGYFEVRLDPERHWLVTRIEIGDPQFLFVIVERIRRMFDLNADWASISRTLQSDPLLAEKLKNEPGLRVPGCWDGFELATRAILGQQVTVKGATVLAGRLVSRFARQFCGPNGLTRLFPEPDILAEAKIASIGLTAARAQTIRALARAVCDRKINFTGIVHFEKFLGGLCEIPGIGKWTAQYVALRALGDPDAFPSGDLGLLRAMNLRSAQDLERRSGAWRPWRAYAALYLWRSASMQTRRYRKQCISEICAGDDLDAASREHCSLA
ncbi:MAG TPA: AlkA N-terminal domain-containing protein [Terriglobales bacterium]